LKKRFINILSVATSFLSILLFMTMCNLSYMIYFSAYHDFYQIHIHQIMIELIYLSTLTYCLQYFHQLNPMKFVICIISNLLKYSVY